SRSEADTARIKSENKLTPAVFRSEFGPEFTEQTFPVLFDLLNEAERDAKYFIANAKTHFARPRPKDAESDVRPAVKAHDEYSYPSGHATRGMLWATILSEIAPAKGKALIVRAQEIAWDRVVGGTHYPSDAYAGEVLGKALAQAMLKSTEFRARLEKAKQE